MDSRGGVGGLEAKEGQGRGRDPRQTLTPGREGPSHCGPSIPSISQCQSIRDVTGPGAQRASSSETC